MRTIIATAATTIGLLLLLDSAAIFFPTARSNNLFFAHASSAEEDFAASTAESLSSSNNNNNHNILMITTLAVQTNETTHSLSQKSAEYTKLQSLLTGKLTKFTERQSLLTAELSSSSSTSNSNNKVKSTESSSISMLHEAMDDVSLKLLELMKRTEDVTRRIGDWNRAALMNTGSSEGGGGEGGLQERLRNVMEQEIERRDRFVVNERRLTTTQHESSDGDEADNDEALAEMKNDDEDHAHAENNDNDVPLPPSPYMTMTQLNKLLSIDNIITPSEHELKMKLLSLAKEMMEQRRVTDEEFWKNHFATLPRKLQQQQQLLAADANSYSSNNGGECINIPSAVQLVANALTSHYDDGGVGMRDVASYENGGSVVYELTSGPYHPPPRNNNGDDEQLGQEEQDVDKATERLYHEQQNGLMMNDDGESGGGIVDKKIDIWGWYTNFKLHNIRKYLPDDWERFLDRLSSSSGSSGGGGRGTTTTNNWGEYTPRGVIDALIPDYIYHAFGISNTASYGSVYGRTASPEVAITAGYSKVGGEGGRGGTAGGGGWSAKSLGNCYPLSMRLENDPVLSLLSRQYMGGGVEDDMDEEDDDTSSLVGPKYTVRLPYPTHIDAVSLEHRAFPLPESTLNDGVRGGESAPRWFKVVGFPPCSDNDNANEAEGECDKLGFDISQPIDLGSFEYHPVTGREDDYGEGGDGDETSNSDRPRRSIQTFTVKGGKMKESGMEEEKEGGDNVGSDEPELEVKDYEIPAGSCAPPKEPDDVPSCGGDTSSSSIQSVRQVVNAVSFIIEENWGNNEYTCLYRVRVHGDSISE